MTICHIVTHFHPRIGGVERSVAALAGAMAAAGHAVTVLTQAHAGLPDVETRAGYTIVRASVARRRPVTRLLYWRWMWRNRRLLDAFDVLHFHDYGTFIHWYFPLRWIVRRPAYAMTFHGFDGWPIRAHHRIFRRLAHRCMHVTIGVGAYLRTLYRETHAMTFIGAPIGAADAAPDSDATSDADALRVFFAGRLEGDTTIDAVLRVLSACAGGGRRRVHVHLAGGGPLSGRFGPLEHERFAVEEHGWLDDTLPLMRDAHVVVGSGFLAILDAMKLGRPVLLPALTPVKRLYFQSIPNVHDVATVVSNEEQLRDMFRGLLDGSLAGALRERAAKARAYADSLSWDTIAGDHIALYERHVGRRA